MNTSTGRASLRAVLLGSLALGSAAAIGAVEVPPRPAGYATDRAGVTDTARLAALNERLAQFERETSNQVLVYVDRRVPSTTTLEEYATAAFAAWGVGQKGKDNGVVFFAFIDDRKMRIEVGYGLEGAIPDARANLILDTYVKPRFRQGDFTGGLEQGAAELMKAARGEPFRGMGRTVAESGATGPLPGWLWGIPIVGLGAAWLAARGGQSTPARLARGGGTWAGLTALLAFASTPITNDQRPLVLGFGVLLAAMAVVAPVLIGRVETLGGRRRVGLALLQAGAGLIIGSFALFCLSVVWSPFEGLAGRALLAGPAALILGGLLRAAHPMQILTLVVGRTAFAVLVVTSMFYAFFALFGASMASLVDWIVVSGLVWFPLWVFARSRGWRMAPKVESTGGGRSYSSSGHSGGWSSSRSSSSSSSSSSSFSGGGGRSGGGGASGSW